MLPVTRNTASKRVSAGNRRGVLVRLDRAEWLASRGDPASRDQASALAAEVLAQVDDKLVPQSPWRVRIAKML